eukprot:239746_1
MESYKHILILYLVLFILVLGTNRSRRRLRNQRNGNSGGRSMSIESFGVRNHRMSASSSIARQKTNGVSKVNLELWSNNYSAFVRIHTQFKDEYKSKNIKINYTSRHFSKTWCNKFEWLHVKYGDISGDGIETFDPMEICVVCNEYYAENNTTKYRGDGRLINGLKIIGGKAPQKGGLEWHEGSNDHKVALGIQRNASDYTVFSWIFFSGKLNTAMTTHPVYMYLIKNYFGGDTGNKLHSINSAKKITIITGSLIKAAVINMCRKSDWLWFGEDGVDSKAGDTFMIWVRVADEGNPMQLFYAVRAEPRKTGQMLYDIFIDVLS